MPSYRYIEFNQDPGLIDVSESLTYRSCTGITLSLQHTEKLRLD